MARVLVACEFSGVVRRAFAAKGYDAWSCDILPAEDGSSQHFQCDIGRVLEFPEQWDLMIAHPPCTHLAVSGARWFSKKIVEQRVHREPPGPDRWKKRSITYQGVAEAMAEQWGSLLG